MYAAASCNLVWNANTEPELAGYMVYYGTASGNYNQKLDVGMTTSTPIYDLQAGVTYYFVVTAYDAARLESEPSVEVSYTVPAPPPVITPDPFPDTEYGRWQSQFFASADPALETTVWGDLADPDRDGRNNVLEYALGLSPNDRNDGNLGMISEVRDAGNGHYHYLTFLRRKNDAELAYIPQVSGDKQTWEADSMTFQAPSVQNLNTDFEVVTYKDPIAVAPGKPRFFQLKVVRNGTVEGASDIYVTTAATIQGNGGSGTRSTYFSLSQVHPWVACGTITALGANSLSDAQATWSEDQFNGANGDYYLEFASGLTVDIEDTVVATKTLTLPGDLRTVLAVGDVYRIRKHYTLTDVFGVNNDARLQGGRRFGSADNVVLLDAATQKNTLYFYYTLPGSVGWYRGDLAPAVNVTIYPEQGITVTRKVAGDVTVYLTGVTKTGMTWAPISKGQNLVSTLKTVKNLKLSELNLVTGNPATGLAGGMNVSAADNLIIPTPSGSVVYFYYNVAGSQGWYDGTLHPAGSVEIPAGSAFYIKRKAPGSFDWVIPAE
jgi:hypothetical protein